jgi:lipopolysaccharide export system protein LptA
VWTPRRILIFLGSSVGLLAAFVVYVIIFGIFDTLPPLPDRFLPGDPNLTPTGPIEDEGIRRVLQAFGNECPELKRKRVYLPSRGAVICVNQFEKVDGRIKLSPFSIGIFAKPREGERFPEINTIQSDIAYLTLDREIKSLAELGRSKVIAVELCGPSGIKIVNNRGTPERHDDLELYIAEKGRLFYEESRNLIWTNDCIVLKDTKTQPLPTQITAAGMEVLLSKDAAQGHEKDKKDKLAFKKAEPKGEGVSGVEKITLKSNVAMDLYVDSNSSLMASPAEIERKAATKAEAKKPASTEKTHLHIMTNGKFVYDLIRETCRFDAPVTRGPLDDRVKIYRYAPRPKDPVAEVLPPPLRLEPSPMPAEPPRKVDEVDVLICDHFDIQFRKKAPEKGAKTPAKAASGTVDQGGDKEIEFAIATADSGHTVWLEMIADKTDATALEMHYFGPKPDSGPRTILKGQPVLAHREGHEIITPELHLRAADKDGNGQEVFAKGPGEMHLLDKATGRRTTHIFWKNSLTSMKDRDGNRLFDLLTLRGDALVTEDTKKQDLKASQFMHLWLETTKAKDGSTKQQPYKLEAFENVKAHSPDLIIHHTNHMTVLFTEKPAAPPSTDVQALPVGLGKDGPVKDVGPAAKTVPAPKDEKKSGKPIEVTAAEVTAFVTMIGDKKELSGALCRGKVEIHQEPEEPKPGTPTSGPAPKNAAAKADNKDTGLDIHGEFVDLKRQSECEQVLEVLSDRKDPARLHFGEMHLFGHKVTIDQMKNKAIVEGGGMLTMPSNKTLDGKPKDTSIKIFWSDLMVFDGWFAHFDGNVQAYQDTGKLMCQSMQVKMDKHVDFKQGPRGEQKPVVDDIVCDHDKRPVILEDHERDAENKLISYRRLQLGEMHVDNKAQRMEGSGVGVGGLLDFIGRGKPDEPLVGKGNDPKPAPQVQPNAGKDDFILKWTRIRFTGNMVSYPLAVGDGRHTKFYDQVRVFHAPGDKLPADDPIAPTKGSLFLTCEKLEVTAHKMKDKTFQEMTAHGGSRVVNFQTDEFRGTSLTVNFNEETDIVIFEGTQAVPAVIYQLPKIQGGAPKVLQGRKILYKRKSGEFELNGVRVISSSWLAPWERPEPFGPAAALAAELLDHGTKPFPASMSPRGAAARLPRQQPGCDVTLTSSPHMVRREWPG